MIEARTINGVIAHIKYGYHAAIQFKGYLIRSEDRRGRLFTLIARVDPDKYADAYLLSLRPLTFVAPHKKGAFRFPVQAIDVNTDGRFVARLGPQVKESPAYVLTRPPSRG